jgi:hypothetical protein
MGTWRKWTMTRGIIPDHGVVKTMEGKFSEILVHFKLKSQMHYNLLTCLGCALSSINICTQELRKAREAWKENKGVVRYQHTLPDNKQEYVIFSYTVIMYLFFMFTEESYMKCYSKMFMQYQCFQLKAPCTNLFQQFWCKDLFLPSSVWSFRYKSSNCQ